ncbi:TetR/AcrR family transcriptional regulator [Sandarakinorhabdus sp. AAP62]|uniref:TetR/AcrR family transcriptional regulator n=1 Tax=Sandarakinorhabdus sp. AAP62 TaxID=1248916 RepID=UPI0002EE2846|nr:TetR/AcrR family transcriptional regulator [Sandarakinorhabdus sp. AAP62]
MIKPTRKELILDAAEVLFAERGFDGVSMRMVADAAPVGLGLLTYHFATKETLFEAVVERRASVLSGARLDALAALVDPTLEELMDAFIRPYRDLIMTGGPGWRSYARLHANLTQDARWTALAMRNFGDVGRTMIDRICAAEPGIDRALAVRGYVHVIGTMVSVFANTGLIDQLSGGTLSSHDIDASLAPMVQFGAGGIRALAKPAPSNI